MEGQRKAIYLDVLVAQIKENKAELELTEEELAQVQEQYGLVITKSVKNYREENHTLKETTPKFTVKWPKIRAV